MNDLIGRMKSRAAQRRAGEWVRARGLCEVQGDQNIANQAGAAFRSDLNNELQALVTQSSGASAPGTTYAHQIWADTTNGVLKKRNAANSGWLVMRTLDETFVLARSTNTILGLSDWGKTLACTSTFTQTLTAAATLGDGWWVQVRNDGTGVITLDPNSTETIDGTLTQNLRPGESCVIASNGSAFKTIGLRRQDAIAVGRNIAARTDATTPNSKFNITADELVLKDASGNTFTAASVSLTVDMAVGGANGLDTGAEASNTWYYGWVLAKGDGTICGVASTSSSAPTLPTDYVYKALVTAVRNDGSSNFVKFRQMGAMVYFEAAQAVLSSGTATTETSVSVSSFVPPPAQLFEMSAAFRVSNTNGSSNEYTAELRYISGSYWHKFQQYHTASVDSPSDTGCMRMPNVSQQFYYLVTNPASGAAPSLSAWVQGFRLPLGGE